MDDYKGIELKSKRLQRNSAKTACIRKYPIGKTVSLSLELR
jgi:hypothetical protein